MVILLCHANYCAIISINGNELDPSQATPYATGLRLLVSDAKHSNYILIQSDGPLTPEQKTTLSALGVVIHKYVSENIYLCGYNPSDIAIIGALPFVVYATVYSQELKIAKHLKTPPAVATTSLHSTAVSPDSELKTVRNTALMYGFISHHVSFTLLVNYHEE